MALMALMCQHACESAVFVVFHEFGYEIVPISKDNILERATRLLKLVSISIGLDLALLSDGRESKIREISCSRSDDLENLFPMKILNRLITEHRKVSIRNSTAAVSACCISQCRNWKDPDTLWKFVLLRMVFNVSIVRRFTNFFSESSFRRVAHHSTTGFCFHFWLIFHTEQLISPSFSPNIVSQFYSQKMKVKKFDEKKYVEEKI